MRRSLTLLLILLPILMYGCNLQLKPHHPSITSDDYYIETIDSCEYIIAGQGQCQMMAHKGNCKYCERRRK